MENQQGTALYVNGMQYQRSANTDGLRTFFGEMRLVKEGEFLDSLKYIFQNGSQNRSVFFADVRYGDYASYERGMSYMMPFYGVKGRISAITARVSLYTELLVCKEEDLAGMSFFDLVFGTEYMQDSESVAESNEKIVAIMQRERKTVQHFISERDRELICKVASKLWEAQEKDPSTRFIIRMDHAEEKSMDLLQSIYMLMPYKLRLQLGFETNVTEKDLKLIQETKGFPIYVLTAEANENFSVDSYSFPIVIYDLNKSNEYYYDQNKIDLLRSVANGMNDLNSVLLDYSEKRVIERNNENYSSFIRYEEYVSNMNNVSYWWNNDDINTVERLKTLYDDQKELLGNEVLKKEAIYEFLTQILPQDKLSDQLAEIAVDENYENRKSLLRFLSDDLFQKSQISALSKTCNLLAKRSEAVLEKKKKEYENQVAAIIEKHNTELESEKQKIDSVKAEKKEIESKLSTAEQEKSNLLKKNKALRRQLEEMGEENAPIKEYKARLNKSSDRIRFLQITSIIGAVLLVGTLVFSIVSSVKTSKLKEQLAEKETLLQTEMSKNIDADNKVRQLEEKIQELETIDVEQDTEAAEEQDAQGGSENTGEQDQKVQKDQKEQTTTEKEDLDNQQVETEDKQQTVPEESSSDEAEEQNPQPEPSNGQ